MPPLLDRVRHGAPIETEDWRAVDLRGVDLGGGLFLGTRFAGADLSAMAQFDQFFGPTTTLKLATTFRNTQRIADVAGRFISRNPASCQNG